MKKLYSFELPKFVEKEVSVETPNEDGSTTIRKEKQKVEEKVKFFIKKPTRALYDQEELFRSWCYKDAVQTHGLIPQALLLKRISEDEGFWSTKDKGKIEEKQKIAAELNVEWEQLKNKENKTDDELRRVDELSKKIADIWLELQSYVYAQETIYHNTAEFYVNRRAIRWWILNLSYNDDNTPVFGEGDYHKRTEKFYELDDSEDEFVRLMLNSFTGLIGMWHNGGLEKQEDFDKFFLEYINQNREIKSES